MTTRIITLEGLRKRLTSIYKMIYNDTEVVEMAKASPERKRNLEKLLREMEEYRLRNRISQAALAEALGVSYPTMNRWLNGHTLPSKIHEYHIKRFLKEGKT